MFMIDLSYLGGCVFAPMRLDMFYFTLKRKEKMKKAARISGKFFWDLRGVAAAAALALIAFPSFAAPFAYVGEAFSSSIRVIDTATNTEAATIATNSFDKVAVHPSGDFIYVPNGSSLDVYGTSDNSLVATIPLGAGVGDLTMHPSGDYVYAAHGRTDTISVIDASTNSLSATVEIAHDISQMVIHPSGSILYVGVAVNGIITAIDTNTLQPIDTFNAGGPNVLDLAVHPSGQYLYVASGTTLKVIDTTTNSVVDSISINGGGYSIAVHPDGNAIYVANYTNSSVSVVDANTNTMTATISTSAPFDLAVHPSGDFVYVTGFTITNTGTDGFVAVIDTASNQITDTISVAANEGSAMGLPLYITIGPLLEPVGGAATGITAISVTCTNSTSGQSVSIGLGSEKAWDCESSGLQVNSGDSIEMVVTGNAN